MPRVQINGNNANLGPVSGTAGIIDFRVDPPQVSISGFTADIGDFVDLPDAVISFTLRTPNTTVEGMNVPSNITEMPNVFFRAFVNNGAETAAPYVKNIYLPFSEL